MKIMHGNAKLNGVIFHLYFFPKVAAKSMNSTRLEVFTEVIKW
jgi:hypothetical protein